MPCLLVSGFFFFFEAASSKQVWFVQRPLVNIRTADCFLGDMGKICTLFTCRPQWVPLLSEPPKVFLSENLLMQKSYAGWRERLTQAQLLGILMPCVVSPLLSLHKSHFHSILKSRKGLTWIFDLNFGDVLVLSCREGGDEALALSCLVLECFAADGQRCLRGLDEDLDVRWQLTDSNAGILVRSAGIDRLPTITDLSVWRCCASQDCDLQSERLWAPVLPFFFTQVPSDYLTLWFVPEQNGATLWISSQAENVKRGEQAA